VRCGATLAAAATPTVDIAAAMPRFAVLSGDGETVGSGLLYRPAMELRARVGGRLAAEP
jgi:hypothetical protein